MSRNIIHAFARSLPIASAALLINIGTAAAATPHSDFQRQVSAVLAGNIASHASPQGNSTRNEAARSQVDAQQFAGQLLQGWSMSHPARTESAIRSRGPAAADVIRQASPAQEDVQSMVQRFLLGRTAARNAS